MKTVILVTGMHRSGTSALTGALAELGVDVPLHADTRIRADNPRGHFEHRTVNQLNNRLLVDAGQTWTSWRQPEVGQLPAASVSRLGDFLARTLDASDADLVAFKDPRISLLLPLWRNLLTERDCRVCVLWSIRDPAEAADSLSRRDGIDRDTCLVMWLGYNLQLCRSWEADSSARVHFPHWLGNGVEALERVGGQLGIRWPLAPGQARAGVEAFVDRGLVHETRDDSVSSPAEQLCRDFYRRLCGDEDSGSGGLPAAVEAFIAEHGQWVDLSARLVLAERQNWKRQVNALYRQMNFLR